MNDVSDNYFVTNFDNGVNLQKFKPSIPGSLY